MCTYSAESAALTLHINNTPDLCSAKHAVFLALARKLARNVYSPAKAPRAFLALATCASRDYCTGTAGNPDEIGLFPRPALCAVCKELARDFESNIMRGTLDDMPTAASVLSGIPGGPAVALTAARMSAGV